MSTPEGAVKAKVKRLLQKYAPKLYYHMPVQNGMGEPTLDITGAFNCRAFAIEAKAPGKKPTERQLVTISRMRAAGITVFVIDGDTTALEEWLHIVELLPCL